MNQSYRNDQPDAFLVHNQHNAGQKRNPKYEDQGKSMWTGAVSLIAVPWLAFLGMMMLYSFLYHNFPAPVVLIGIACFALSIAYTTLNLRINGNWYLAFGLLCMIGIVMGNLAGLYNYHEYMMQFWAYDENREYTNVLPSEPAAAHADAGKISFSQSARIDTTKAVGFKAGDVYCVAPIMDETQTSRVEYWAAGVNCCKQRADFQCDSASDPTARSAVVILDTNSWVSSDRDFYLKAVKEAEAAYDIVSAPAPLFVRWVDNPAQVQLDFWRAGIGTLMGAGAIYFLISFIVGIAIAMTTKRAQREAAQ